MYAICSYMSWTNLLFYLIIRDLGLFDCTESARTVIVRDLGLFDHTECSYSDRTWSGVIWSYVIWGNLIVQWSYVICSYSDLLVQWSARTVICSYRSFNLSNLVLFDRTESARTLSAPYTLLSWSLTGFCPWCLVLSGLCSTTEVKNRNNSFLYLALWSRDPLCVLWFAQRPSLLWHYFHMKSQYSCIELCLYWKVRSLLRLAELFHTNIRVKLTENWVQLQHYFNAPNGRWCAVKFKTLTYGL